MQHADPSTWDDDLDSSVPIVYDLRLSDHIVPVLSEKDLSRCLDLRLISGGQSLDDLCDRHVDPDLRAHSIELQRKLSIFQSVAAQAEIDLKKYAIWRTVPTGFVQDYFRTRAEEVYQVGQRALLGELGDIERYFRDTWPVQLALFQMEKAGICLRPTGEPDGEMERSMRRLVEKLDGEPYHVEIDQLGTKTGRFTCRAKAVNPMSLPRGYCRQAVVSRWLGGKILSLDFNAIDFRSIVAAVGDPDLVTLYHGVPDFHTRTGEIVFGPDWRSKYTRDNIKYGVYILAYGGSRGTLAQKTGLSLFEAERMAQMIESRFPQIVDFRFKLGAQARLDGHVTMPNGVMVPVDSEDHDGKVMGLFAQTYSSHVFRQAFVWACAHLKDRKSVPIFTVHDELVVDMHPDELEMLPQELARGMSAEGFYVRTKIGESYDDVE